ncbi:MAG: HlyD family type I secretion periplasmic adaptor subunit, partial [Burkholderiales bacterium]
VFGRLDIVAVADGKLVPSSYLKIVQPAEQGIVREILVKEGEAVQEGQVLIRMDSVLAAADEQSLRTDYDNKRLALRRIDAQLSGARLAPAKGDPPELFAQVSAQYEANVRSYENALAQERSLLDKAGNDLAAAQSTKSKLEQVLPHYIEQEKAFAKLEREGFAGRILSTDKTRERVEKEQDLRTQEFIIRSNLALIEQSERKLSQITADYRRQLRTERVEVASQADKLRQELAKQAHRSELLELRAPQAGTVKDLATHTVGTVAAPGTILMTLVPQGDTLIAEVWVGNQDIGFVRPGQGVKLKLAAFQFQKYGMVEGVVHHVSADATEAPSANTRSDALGGRDRPMGPLAYRALLALKAQALDVDGNRYALAAGMQVSSEINLGTRSILEYVLSPVQKAWHEAGRER